MNNHSNHDLEFKEVIETKVRLKELEERKGKFEFTHEILGMDFNEYVELEKEKMKEFIDILKTGSYSEASVKLLRWLGFDEEEVEVEKIIKAIVIIRYSVRLTDYVAQRRAEQK